MSQPGVPENDPQPFKGRDPPPEYQQKKKRKKPQKKQKHGGDSDSSSDSDSDSDVEVVKPPKAPPREDYNYNMPPITTTDTARLGEPECRDAMIQHVNEHCCYGMKPAEEMTIRDFKGCTALHLSMETFAEGRKTKDANEPYRGGPVDGPENGPMPAPWDIKQPPNKLFENHKIKVEVPHSSVIEICWGCEGRGWNQCPHCNGSGRTRCSSCSGSGQTTHLDQQGQSHQVTCGTCHGSGETSCFVCGGDGQVRCFTCMGYKRLRCFVLLICKFINHVEDYVLETTDMPDALVATVGGTVLFEDTNLFVKPIVSYPVPQINSQSAKLVETHERNWPAQRILQQRQTLRGVPVTEVNYEWEEVVTRFWVYGNERKVYAPDYPQQCCCGCSVI